MFVVLLSLNIQAKISPELDEAFSKSSREYLIDYQLLQSVAYASSKLNPFFIKIGNLSFSPKNKEGFLYLAENDGWVFNMEHGNTSQFAIIKNSHHIVSYLEKFGSSRDYSLIKIRKNQMKVGIMALTPYKHDLTYISKPSNNISMGAKRLRSYIDEYGLENSVLLFCECDDNYDFQRVVSDYYLELSGKELDTLYK
jgi:hypothetical protein